MKFVIKDRIFTVDRGRLSAAIPDPYWSQKYNPAGDPTLFWSVEIDATEIPSDDEMWHPRVYHENLHFNVRKWVDIAGKEFRWDSPFDEKSGEPHGGFYVWEHGNINRARLRFLERDGLRFRIEWDGFCDIFWDDEYGKDVPFAIEAWVSFTEIVVRGSEWDTDASLRTQLAQYLDVDDFVQNPIQVAGHTYVDGVKMAHAVFKPINE